MSQPNASNSALHLSLQSSSQPTQGYKSLEISTAHQKLIDEAIDDEKFNPAGWGLASYPQGVQDSEAEEAAERAIDLSHKELSDRLSSDLPVSRKNRDRNRSTRSQSRAAALIDELCLVLDAFLLDVIDHHNVRAISAPLHLAVTNMLQAGQTTAYAVALLLKHGYVVDADARWRGLYELSCQAAVLSKATDPKEASLRYLMHGQNDLAERRLKAKDLSNGKAIVHHELQRGGPNVNPQTNQQGPPFWERDYQWIPAELLRGGTSQKQITQKDLFSIADLKIAPKKFVDDSHRSVHMSSLVVADESAVALDNDPGGYSAVLEDGTAERTALTLYELVAHCCLLAELQTGNRYVAWAQEFHERVRAAVEELN